MTHYDSLLAGKPPYGHLLMPPDLPKLADRVGATYAQTPVVRRVLPNLSGCMLVALPQRRLGPALWGYPNLLPGPPMMTVYPPAISPDRWRELARRRAVVPVLGYELTPNPRAPRTLSSPYVAWLAAVYTVHAEPAPRAAYFALVTEGNLDPVLLLEAHFDQWLLRGNLPKGSAPKRDVR